MSLKCLSKSCLVVLLVSVSLQAHERTRRIRIRSKSQSGTHRYMRLKGKVQADFKCRSNISRSQRTRGTEVRFASKQRGIQLAGTLVVPRGPGPFPAAVLLNGSGSQDRNGSVFGQKPMEALAEFLAGRGIASLRYDDRGIGGSNGCVYQATTQDLSLDAQGAVTFLQSRKEIDPKRIGLIGHSEGGLLAALVAAQRKEIVFVVLLASPGIPGADLLLLQRRLMLQCVGGDEKTQTIHQKTLNKVFRILRKQTTDTTTRNALQTTLVKAQLSLPAISVNPCQTTKPDACLEAQLDLATSPWFRFFIDYEPSRALRQIQCPVLVLNGDRDCQVPPDENLLAIKRALQTGKNTDFTIKKLEGYNHLFQQSESGCTQAYPQSGRIFSPPVLRFIHAWLLPRIY